MMAEVTEQPCEHRRQWTTAMWPPEVNAVSCMDCGTVLREMYSNLQTVEDDSCPACEGVEWHVVDGRRRCHDCRAVWPA